MMHTLITSMSLPRARDQVFAFFAEATNLERITPPELGFKIVTPGPLYLREGTRIDYRLHLFGIPFSWQTEIQHWNPPEAFVDVQRRGPYQHWVHTHRFWEEHGTTIIEDEVQYVLPYAPLSELLYPLVRLQLHRIFRYRQHAIRAYFFEGTSQH
jgi:ligand-binding SRPBCC domain-containing protein